MYKIKLPIFEGPSDLLLYLIRKNELDIYDIPIAEIIRQFLDYLKLIQLLDLEVAGEFIEMVATLMLIKARMLLPHSEDIPEDELEDPRRQLVLQLLEYKRYKEASENLRNFQEDQRKLFPRNIDQIRNSFEKSEEEDDFTIDATLFDLLSAFKQALDNMPKITVHQVNMIKITIEDQVKFLIDQIGGNKHVLFSDLQKKLKNKITLIVTFMAILDLIRLRFLTAKQTKAFEDIRLVSSADLTLEKYMRFRNQEENQNQVEEVINNSPNQEAVADPQDGK
jgi:segregation and condensation protein A